jgi:hypothetical protein
MKTSKPVVLAGSVAAVTLALASLTVGLAAAGDAKAQGRPDCGCGWPSDLEAAIGFPTGANPPPVFPKQPAPHAVVETVASTGDMSLKTDERCAALHYTFSDPDFAEQNGVPSFPKQAAQVYFKRVAQRRGVDGLSDLHAILDDIAGNLKTRGRSALMVYVDEASACARRAG